MRTWVLAALCTVALLAVGAAGSPSPAGEKYTNRYDHIDIDAILSNKRTFKVYLNCLLEEGDCPPEGKELRAHIPEALRTACARCTASQKMLLRKAIRYLRTNNRAALDQITQHYDPEGKYREPFGQFVDSNN